MVKATFFTVTYFDDYDFLLGSIEHHAEMGRHVVLDTSPADKAIKFNRLPDSVQWFHEPNFGHGWKEFKVRTALERAMSLAKELEGEILIYLDSDDFYSSDSPERLFPYATEAIVGVNYTHWKKDGFPYIFGPSEWHSKLWPKKSDVRFALNEAWKVHSAYDGNPERHPVAVSESGFPYLRVQGNFRHHLHYALGPKAEEETTALATVDGWPNGSRVPKVPWPAKLDLWKNKGIRPSEFFR